MPLVLKDSDNNTLYRFPDGFHLSDYGLVKRVGTENRVLQHGSVIVGDKYISDRQITITGVFGASTLDEFESDMTTLKRNLNRTDMRLYGAYKTDQFFKIKALQNFTAEFLNDGGLANVEIVFVADPFRYAQDQTSVLSTVLASPANITVTVDGDVEVYPRVTYTAGSTQTSIQLKNLSDNNLYFSYAPASSLVAGDVVEFDFTGESVEVELNGVDDLDHFSNAPVKLLSGENILKLTITGTVGTCSLLQVDFRNRYL